MARRDQSNHPIIRSVIFPPSHISRGKVATRRDINRCKWRRTECRFSRERRRRRCTREPGLSLSVGAQVSDGWPPGVAFHHPSPISQMQISARRHSDLLMPFYQAIGTARSDVRVRRVRAECGCRCVCRDGSGMGWLPVEMRRIEMKLYRIL